MLKKIDSKLTRVGQTTLGYSCDAGKANVNVATGRLIFEHGDMNVGGNTFNINISHIYDSHFRINKEINIGNKWKLNIQQYLLPYKYEYELTGFSLDDFVYIDSLGNIHQLRKITGTSRYYDLAGSGLEMSYSGTSAFLNYYLKDSAGNQLVFNYRGYLIESWLRTPESYACKIYSYDSQDRIIKVYDSRHLQNNQVVRYISLKYNNNSLLSSMSFVTNGQEKEKIVYAYENNNLRCIAHTINNSISNVTCFSYDKDNNLVIAGNSINNMALQFNYTDSKVTRVTKGSTIINTKLAEQYLGDGTYSGETLAISLNSLELNNKTDVINSEEYLGADVYSSPLLYPITLEEDNSILSNGSLSRVKDDKILEETAICYFSNSLTSVTNDKGLTFNYYFNPKGMTTGIFEVGNNGELMTLTKDGGISVISSTTGKTINGSPIISGETKYSMVIKSSIGISSDYFKFNNFNEFGLKNNPIRYYICSFWLKHSISNSATMKAKLLLTIAGVDREYYVYVDHTAKDAWQYVTIPVEIKGLVTHIEASYCRLKIDTDANGSYEIANMRFAPGSSNKLMLKALTNDYYIGINESYSIKVKDTSNKTTELVLNANNYLTDSDIMKICRNMQSLYSFDFVYCGGTKIIANIKEVYVKVSNDQYSGYPTNDYQLFNSKSDGNNYFNVRYKQISPDNNIITYKDFYLTSKDELCESTIVKDNDKKKNFYTTTITDNQGRAKQGIDSYGIKVLNKYDKYGNILSTVIAKEVDFDSTGLNVLADRYCMEKKYSYDNEGSDGKYREFVTSEYNQDMTTSTAMNHNIFGAVDTISIGNLNPIKYSYDHQNRLNGISAMNGNTKLVGNSFSFDENGRLKTVTDSDNYQYKIAYDEFGNTSKYSILYGNEEILVKEKTFVRKGNTTGLPQIQEYDASTSTTSFIFMDKYDRVNKSITVESDGTNSVEYTYQQKGESINSSEFSPKFYESQSTAKIKKIKDNYEKSEYEYYYDNDNNPCGYQQKKTDGTNQVTIQQLTSDKTKYIIGNTKYMTGIFDNDNILAPRIESTKNYYDNSISSDADWKEIDDYKSTYQYDDILGTITNKVVGTGSSKITTDISWRPTNGSKKLSGKIYSYQSTIGSNSLKHEYSYNGQQSLTNIKETKVLGQAYTNYINYSYDGLNRLKTEYNSALGINYRYEYTDNNGKDRNRVMKVYSNTNTLIKEFELDNLNRLTKYKENGKTIKEYTYGKYLNPTSIKNVLTYNLTWTRNNLLAKYEVVSYNNTQYNEYKYNYQGIRYYKKITNGLIIDYFYDGDKLLGEDHNNGVKLRYFYDLTGVTGFRYIDSTGTKDYKYVKDGLGNIVLITHNSTVVAEYKYDVWGKCTVTWHNGSSIGTTNPFRWKGHYLDTETELYYINGRYYDPQIGQYLGSQSIENVITKSEVINGLNMYAVAVDNPLATVTNMISIYTSSELAVDPTCKPNAGDTWWETNKKRIIKALICLAILTIGVALICFGGPAVAAFGQGMLLAATGAAISNAVIGGLIGGIISAVNGNGFWNGLSNSVIDGFLDGFITGAIMYCVAAGASALASRFKPVNAVDDMLQFESHLKLETHFSKHSTDFNGLYQTADDYLVGANYVAKNGSKVSYAYKGEIRTGYVKFYGNSAKGYAKFAFVGTNNSGYITTYHIKKAKDLWKLLGTIGVI